MKALPTQFDSGRLSTAVATPTCSSCCCCCCCATAIVATSVVSAQRVNYAGKRNGVGSRGWYVAIAALFLPVAVLIGWWISRAAQAYPGNCGFVENKWGEYLDCAVDPALPGLIGGVGAAFLLLWLAYRRVRAVLPLLTAAFTMVVFIAVFVLEFFIGGIIVGALLNAGGPLLYLALAAAAIGLITTNWSRSLERDHAAFVADEATSDAIAAGGDDAPPPTHDD